MAGEIHGVYRAKVVNNNDPLQRSRLQVQIPQLLGQNTTEWVDAAQQPLTMPLVGSVVWVSFEGGSPDHPVWWGQAPTTQPTTNLITPQTGSIVPLTVNGVSGQSAYLQEWKNNGASVSRITAGGSLDLNIGTYLGNAAAGPMLAFPAGAGAYSTDAVNGDVVLRSNGGQIRFNLNGGAGASMAQVTSAGLNVNGVVTSNNLTPGESTGIGGENLFYCGDPNVYPQQLSNQGGATNSVTDGVAAFYDYNSAGSYPNGKLWSVTIPTPGSNTDYYKGVIHPTIPGVQPSSYYTMSVMIYPTSTVTLYLRLTQLTSGGAYITEGGIQQTFPANTWTRATGVIQMASNCYKVQFSTQFPYTPGTPTACTYYMTNIQLQHGQASTNYLPGRYGTWMTPAMQNGWVSYDGGATFAVPGYIKLPNGLVKLKGLIKSGTTTDGTVIFNLPSGYRPALTLHMPCANAAGVMGGVHVASNGDVNVWAGAGINNSWLSLDVVNFMAEQ